MYLRRFFCNISTRRAHTYQLPHGSKDNMTNIYLVPHILQNMINQGNTDHIVRGKRAITSLIQHLSIIITYQVKKLMSINNQ